MKASQRGSAPRVRGTQHYTKRLSHRNRFSPARAGNSRHCAASYGLDSVQPRACGELLKNAGYAEEMPGSAPRVRGTHALAMLRKADDRFSPARAGNS